jgi:predicted ATPase
MQLQVQLNKGGIWHNITEVGYGVALHIPILLQTLISDLKGGEILLLEQPEIHIHPRLHAKLLETLVKAGEKNTYIIETHSADMVRELQVLVKQGVLQPEDVTVHYFTREATQTKVVLHSLDKDGIFDIDIPEDFYENYYDLAMKLAE